MDEKTKKILKVVISIIIALISVFVVSRFATSTEFHAKTIQSLDEKKSTVMELTAASTAASAAISLLPGDTGIPIAEKLTDLSSYFLLVLCALYLEKYLLTITGYAAFVILIPAACLLIAFNAFRRSESVSRAAKKIALFGLAITIVIPASVKVADMVEDTYRASIDSTLESAKEATEEIEESAKDSSDSKSDEGFLAGIISTVQNGVSGVTNKIQTVLNDFIEALAVMIVTSCIIPLAVLFFFVWLVKIVLGIDINMKSRRKIVGGK